MPDSLREAADLVVEIPQFGIIDSLNVATAATVVIFTGASKTSRLDRSGQKPGIVSAINR